MIDMIFDQRFLKCASNTTGNNAFNTIRVSKTCLGDDGVVVFPPQSFTALTENEPHGDLSLDKSSSYSEGEEEEDDNNDNLKERSEKNKYTDDSDFEVNNDEEDDRTSKDSDEDEENDENLKKRRLQPILERQSKRKKHKRGKMSYSEGEDEDDNDDNLKKRSNENKYTDDSDFEVSNEEEDDDKEAEEQNDILNADVIQNRANSDGLDWNNGAFRNDAIWDRKDFNIDFCEWRGKSKWGSPAKCMDNPQQKSLSAAIVTLTEKFARYSQRPDREDWPQQEWVLLQFSDINGCGQKYPKKHRSKTAVNAYGRKEAIATYNNWQSNTTNTKEGGDWFVHRSTSSLEELQSFGKVRKKLKQPGYPPTQNPEVKLIRT
jgi:hypothetical protein